MSDEQRERPGRADAGASTPTGGEPSDEPMGGDPPCWAHLFGEGPGLAAEDQETPGP